MVEQTKYEIVKKIENLEIRLYDQIIVAEVAGLGDGEFNILFNYISGDNVPQKKLEMTAPVISQKIEMTAPVFSEGDSIAFIIPKKFSFENVPKPTDSRINIKQIPKRYVAALRFSGRWSTSAFVKKSNQLLEVLNSLNIKTKGNMFSMRYNGPFTPWFMRRNEVAVEIDYNG
jgi:hypothetical protein